MPIRKNPSRFPRVLNISNFFTADVTLQPSVWNTVGSYTVPYGQEITFGVGTLGATDSREPCYIFLGATTTTGLTNHQIAGRIRLSLSDPNQVNEVVVVENRTERFSASQSDKTQALLLGEFPTLAQEQSLLLMKCYIDSASAVTVDQNGTATLALIPVTVYM